VTPSANGAAAASCLQFPKDIRLTYNPPCFAKQNPSPLARRGFYSLFCGAKSESTGEERILLLVLRSKMQFCFVKFALW